MPAAVTDLLDRGTDSATGRPVVSSLAAPGKAIGASSINLSDATNWTATTGIHFSIYKVNAQGYKDSTTQTDWKGVLAAGVISNLTLTGGTDQAYNAGDIVELTPTARYAKDIYDWGSSFANQDGSLKTSAVQTALNIGNSPAAGWNPIAATPVYTGNNGQKEFTLNFPLNLTTTLQKGMKLQVTRGTTPPTQSMAFTAASSQYGTKASPAGLTGMTGPFTVEAWIKLNSYPTSGTATIIARDSTNTGFGCRINTSGQLEWFYGNGTNTTTLDTYQAIPLNRWVHIAAVVTSTAIGTGAAYLNGASVPIVIAVGATIFAQASTNLNVGGDAAANTYFDGSISELRVWGVAQSQANVQANMAISLTGSESNLLALFQGNGNFNDKTSNANNLTATNGALATQAANPYNAVEYAIVTNIGAFSGGNTPVTVFCGTDCMIPNMALSNPQYSVSRAPYGFPAARGKWIVDFLWQLRQTIIATSNSAWYNPGTFQLSVPIGAWNLRFQMNGIVVDATSTPFVRFRAALSTSASAISSLDLIGDSYMSNATMSQINDKINRQGPIMLSADTTYYLIMQAPVISGTTTLYAGSQQLGGIENNSIVAECAYI